MSISWGQQTTILPSDPNYNGNFGVSISVDGNYAIIGADGNDGGNYKGAAYIFKKSDDDETWSQQAKLEADETRENSDIFGASVSISNNYAVIGAAGD